MADPESDAAGLTYDPVADLAQRHPDWTVCRVHLGWGIRETLCLRRRVILLDVAGSPADARSSLAHAVAHVDLDHAPLPAGFFELRQEREADAVAARRLMPASVLARVLAWTRSPAEVAAELGVDRALLAARLRTLSPSERAALERSLARLDAA